MALFNKIAVIALLVAAAPAGARTYCCNDDKGHRVCGDILPAQCQAQAYNELNSQGVLKKRHEAPLTAEKREAREAELARKKAAEREAVEQARRDRALVASYASVEDIDEKLRRTLAGTQADIKAAQDRLNESKARHGLLMGAAAIYGADKLLPETLKANIADNDQELVNRQAELEAKQKEVSLVKERFAYERARYLQLTGRARPEPAPVAPTR